MAEVNAFPYPKLPVFTVATVPSAAAFKDCVIKVSNGSAGDPCIAVSDGTNWKVNGGTTTIAAT